MSGGSEPVLAVMAAISRSCAVQCEAGTPRGRGAILGFAVRPPGAGRALRRQPGGDSGRLPRVPGPAATTGVARWRGRRSSPRRRAKALQFGAKREAAATYAGWSERTYYRIMRGRSLE